MPLDSQIAIDGDSGFVGFASRPNPMSLPAGVLQESVNMRLDRGVARVRKGAKRLADSISAGEPPLTIPVNIDDNKVLRETYTGGIFGAGVFASQNYDNANEYIVLCGPDRAFLYRQGAAIDEKPYPTTTIAETITEGDTVSVLQAYDRLYVLREAPIDPATTFKQQFTNSSGITVSSTTATVNVNTHGLSAGMRVRIEGSSVAAFDGHEFDIVNAAPAGNASQLTITVPSGTSNDATAGIKVRRVKCPIYWDGVSASFVRASGGIPAEGPTYKRMRSVGWAAYINGRMLIPDGRDQVAVSDIGNPDLYDPYWASFKANEGSSDYLVAIHPWVEGSVLVFMRRSIWLAEINDLNVANGNDTLLSRLTILTDEIGCSARKSIATAGQFVYFLSDAGVYRLDSRLDLKLRGDTKPLSDAISDQIATVDAEAAAEAVGLWHNNRYYIAFQAVGQDNQRTVFVYNALNEAWESRDVLVSSVDDFLVTNYENERRLFTSSRTGKLFLLEEREDGDDAASSTQVVDILGKIKTRRFSMGTMTQKRFLRSIADVVIPNGGQLLAGATTYNPDQEVGSAYTLNDDSTVNAMISLTNSTGSNEDYHIKAPIRQKAHAAELTFYTNGARPEIRGASIEAAMAGLPQTDTKNVA